MRRLRLRIAATLVHRCFRVDSKSIDNVFGAVTPRGDSGLEQLSSKASQALQAGALPPLLTPQLSINLAHQVTPKAQAVAQRLIQTKKKPGITPKAQDSIIQQAISLLYGKGFYTKDTQVAYI